MDLTPRTTTTLDTPVAKPKKRWGAWLVLAAVLVGGGVVVTKFLTSAIDYYCNADEVGVADKCSGERRMRVQGAVEQGSLKQSPAGVVGFMISFNGVSVPVDYANGAVVPDLFQECIPVVVAGQLQGGMLIGSSVEVKHSNEYVAANPNRVDDTESNACTVKAVTAG